MSEYKYIPPEECGLTLDNVVFLKAIKPVEWFESHNKDSDVTDTIPIGSITWIMNYSFYVKKGVLCKDDAIHPEKNRHGVNYDPNSFEIIPFAQDILFPVYNMRVTDDDIVENRYAVSTRLSYKDLSLKMTNSNFSEHGL